MPWRAARSLTRVTAFSRAVGRWNTAGVADDFLGETDLRAQNAEVILHVGRRVLENHAEIVERVGHDAERISELVADAAGELAEHGELLAPDQRFLR